MPEQEAKWPLSHEFDELSVLYVSAKDLDFDLTTLRLMKRN